MSKKKPLKLQKNMVAGAGSSRLISGTLSIHEKLETKIAHHKNYPMFSIWKWIHGQYRNHPVIEIEMISLYLTNLYTLVF